ncbi:hypothetical protein [Candidatus Chloroploca asiatica]|uniref:Uncharacterized protein n=1 Tax=Candidatus Chloroploca asiatica TaxID=1506545 RepID=A0A2H3KH17_9CHLR|nr:hypothetical protein [Candidatus Chloroploca asiatica]PDV97029.1 hypothetical protein A9Q02_19670 [Candidatus Chloroploca asiatica]
MEKQIGFRQNIYLNWLDATAAMCSETSDMQELRARLDPIVAEQVQSQENRQVAISILLSIWVKTGEQHAHLRNEAVNLFAHAHTTHDRVWLHYGLSLLAYPFFRQGMVALGQLLRHRATIRPHELEARLAGELGQLGGLPKATDRLIFSLRNWGVLQATAQRSSYAPQRHTATSPAIEQWMLEAAFAAHPAQDLPFADLIHLPELFPFRFTLTIDDLRRTERFEVQRQGMGWDMVRLKVDPY